MLNLKLILSSDYVIYLIKYLYIIMNNYINVIIFILSIPSVAGSSYYQLDLDYHPGCAVKPHNPTTTFLLTEDSKHTKGLISQYLRRFASLKNEDTVALNNEGFI